MTEPSVTILTNERDFAADEVISWLHRASVHTRRINIEEARRSPIDVWNVQLELARSPTAGSVVWWRQFQTDDHPGTAAEIDDVLLQRAQWRTWLSTLASPGALWVNDLWASRRAEDKVEQLRTAGSVGLLVPPTLVTNDPLAAVRFQSDVGECVVKTLSTAYFSFSDQGFVYTELLSRALDHDGQWYEVPLTIQKRLRGSDARVISFGDESFSARCNAPGLDWRKTPFDQNAWERWQPPTHLLDKCHSYRRVLGLKYAAFDFMIDGSTPYFLEANQAGEWLFLDRTLNLGISYSFANYLSSQLSAHE